MANYWTNRRRNRLYKRKNKIMEVNNMSRSYKHTPISKDISRISKQQANKKVRQRLKDVNYDIGNNAHYKSIVES